MILISHRGNLNGPNPEKENHPDYILEAINQGYDVEVDVWYINGEFYLGHDKPQYKTSKIFLSNNCLWIHCKNAEALDQFKFDSINYFFHQNDPMVITSKRFIWANPGQQPIKNSIAVLPELNNDDLTQCSGICSDYIENYKK